MHSDTKIRLSESPLKGGACSFRMVLLGVGGGVGGARSTREYADGYAKHAAARSGRDANVEKNHATPRKPPFLTERRANANANANVRCAAG